MPSPNYALKTVPGLVPWSHSVLGRGREGSGALLGFTGCHLYQDLGFWPIVCHCPLLGAESILSQLPLLSGILLGEVRGGSCVYQGLSLSLFITKGRGAPRSSVDTNSQSDSV